MSNEVKIRYSERVEETELLGPGKRAVLWVHGCCFDCPGCVAQNFKHGSYSEAVPRELAGWYLAIEAEGLTISGGEPMLQALALAEMITEIRKVKDVGVIVYSGFQYEKLLEMAQEDQGVKSFLEKIDILIDGPYLQEEDHNEPYRGSANQRIISLTERYKEQVDFYYYQSIGRKIEFRFNSQKTLMVGVPSKEQTAIWANIKKLGEKKEH